MTVLLLFWALTSSFFSNITSQRKKSIIEIKKICFFFLILIFLQSCSTTNSEGTRFDNISLEPAETIKLISPFEGRLIDIANENKLFLTSPDFPPGQYVDYQVGHPIYGVMPGLSVDKRQQVANINKLDENAIAKIVPADSLAQSVRKHKATIYQARWALHSSGLPAFNQEIPIWQHYEVFAPKLSRLIKASYTSIRNHSTNNSTLPDQELRILVKSRLTKDLDESMFRDMISGTLLELVVKDIERSTKEIIPPSDIIFGISEAAFWAFGHNAEFQEHYYVTPHPNRFDTWAPNDLNLISKTVSFKIPRSRIGYGAMRMDTNYPVKSKELQLPKSLHDKSLLRFSSYWSFKAENGYFSLYDKAFIVTIIKAALKLNPNIRRDYQNEAFGDYKSYLDLIDQIESNLNDHFTRDNKFRNDPVFGLLVREQLNLNGIKYVANILINEVKKANKALLTRYYSNMLARCTYICRPGYPFHNFPKFYLNIYEKYGMRAEVKNWKSEESYNDIASIGNKVKDVEFNNSQWNINDPNRRNPLEQSWIVNELRKPVSYQSPFLIVSEEDPILRLYETRKSTPRYKIAFTGKFGPYFISIDNEISVKTLQSSNAWGQTQKLGEVGDTWNYHKRILGSAYDGAQSIITVLSNAYQMQRANLFVSAIRNVQSIERSMGHKLFLESKIINDELNSLSKSVDDFLIVRQGGQLFPIDDARILTAKKIKKNDWVKVDTHILTYHHEFEYKAKLRRNSFFSLITNHSVENLTERGVYSGVLSCVGKIFFRDPQERFLIEDSLGSDHPVIIAAEKLQKHSFDVELYVEPDDRNKMEKFVFLKVRLPQEERYIPIDISNDSHNYQWVFQNSEMIKDGKLRLISGLHWPGLECKLYLN